MIEMWSDRRSNGQCPRWRQRAPEPPPWALEVGSKAARRIPPYVLGAGSLASKDRVTTDQLSAIAGSLIWFASGVASSALTAFFSYLTNFFYLVANAAHLRLPDFPYFAPTRQFV